MTSVRRRKSMSLVIYLALGIISFLVLFPFIFTISASLVDHYIGIRYIFDLIPSEPTLKYYRKFVTDLLFWRWMFNSIFVATAVSVAKMFIDSAAGYALAIKRFPGRNMMINLCLFAMAIPFFIPFLPNFFIVRNFGWLNTYWALIIPPLSIPMGVFLSLQFLRVIPRELVEAARIDGCSELGIYRRIILPVSKPLLGALGVYYFLIMWTAFLWPYVVTTGEDMKVIPVAVAALRTAYVPNYSPGAALVVFSFVPISVFFLVMQGYLNRVIGLGVVRK